MIKCEIKMKKHDTDAKQDERETSMKATCQKDVKIKTLNIK